MARGVATDLRVIEWVDARRQEGMTRNQIVRASHEPGYPGRHPLSNGSLVAVDAVLFDRRRQNGTTAGRSGPTHGGSRVHALRAEARAGRKKTDVWQLQLEVSKATQRLEGVELVGLQWDEFGDLDRQLRYIREDLLTMGHFQQKALEAVDAQLGNLKELGTIQKTRDRANHPNTSEHERIVSLRKAEQLEARRVRRFGSAG